MGRRLVLLESPYQGDVEQNVRYARAALRDCLLRGEAPYASHLLYTQHGVLNDNDQDERRIGIEAGLEWGARAAATVVYDDLGISPGMKLGILRAIDDGREVEHRSLSGWVATPLKLVPKSKPSKVSFTPSSRFLVGVGITFFWLGFLVGWMARGA